MLNREQPEVAGRTAKDARMLFGFSGLLGKFRFCPVGLGGLGLQSPDTSLCIRRFRPQLPAQATGRIACFCSSLRLAGSDIELGAAAGGGQRRARFLELRSHEATGKLVMAECGYIGKGTCGWPCSRRQGGLEWRRLKMYWASTVLNSFAKSGLTADTVPWFKSDWVDTEPQQPLRSWVITQGSAAHSELMRPKRSVQFSPH